MVPNPIDDRKISFVRLYRKFQQVLLLHWHDGSSFIQERQSFILAVKLNRNDPEQDRFAWVCALNPSVFPTGCISELQNSLQSTMLQRISNFHLPPCSFGHTWQSFSRFSPFSTGQNFAASWTRYSSATNGHIRIRHYFGFTGTCYYMHQEVR